MIGHDYYLGGNTGVCSREASGAGYYCRIIAHKFCFCQQKTGNPSATLLGPAGSGNSKERNQNGGLKTREVCDGQGSTCFQSRPTISTDVNTRMGCPCVPGDRGRSPLQNQINTITGSPLLIE